MIYICSYCDINLVIYILMILNFPISSTWQHYSVAVFSKYYHLNVYVWAKLYVVKMLAIRVIENYFNEHSL